MKDHLQDSDFKIFSHKPLNISYMDLFLAIGLLLGSQFVIGLIQGLLIFVFGESISFTLQPITFALSFALPIAAFYFFRMKDQHEHFNYHFTGSKWYVYPIIILFFLGCMIFIEPIIESIPTSDPAGILDFFYNIMEQMEVMLNDYPISTSITIVIMAPIFEELFFRGLILKGLLNNKKINNFWAIFLSAIIFGVIHLNPWQLVGAFLLGLVLGFVYYKTRSILNVMLLHFINNGLGIYLFYEYDAKGFMELFDWTPSMSLGVGAGAIAIFGLLFNFLTKNLKWKSY